MKTHNKVTALQFAVNQLVIALYQYSVMAFIPLPKSGLNFKVTDLHESNILFYSKKDGTSYKVMRCTVTIASSSWSEWEVIRCEFYKRKADHYKHQPIENDGWWPAQGTCCGKKFRGEANYQTGTIAVTVSEPD